MPTYYCTMYTYLYNKAPKSEALHIQLSTVYLANSYWLQGNLGVVHLYRSVFHTTLLRSIKVSKVFLSFCEKCADESRESKTALATWGSLPRWPIHQPTTIPDGPKVGASSAQDPRRAKRAASKAEMQRQHTEMLLYQTKPNILQKTPNMLLLPS